MRVVRFWVPGGGSRLGVYEDGTVQALATSDSTFLESFDALVELAGGRGRLTDTLRRLRRQGPTFPYRDLDRAPNPEAPHLLLPVQPLEVWAAGVTYERSREARLAETTTVGIYDKIYDAERPELFFKATASRCVGPNAPIGIRSDSRWTVPEPELAVVLSEEGQALGYTLGNDMILLSDEPVERRLTLWCRIERRGREVFRGEVSTSRIRRPISELVAYLRRANDIPPMTVLLTGTGIVPPDEFACEEGDVIEIGADEIGILRNPTVRVS